MVFILDEGSKFSASIDKVWKLNQSEGEHLHASVRNRKAVAEGDHMIVSTETAMPDGTWVKNKTRITAFYPLGIMFETLEGPMAGSKSFQYYTPMGKETGVTVVGEFTSKVIPGSQLRTAQMEFLEILFNEDQKNLAKM